MIILITLFGLCGVTITSGLFLDVIPIWITRWAAVVYFLGTGALIARNLTGFSWARALLCAPLSLVSLIGGIGGIVYFFFDLTLPALILLLWLPLAVAILSMRLRNQPARKASPSAHSLPLRPHALLLSSLYVLCIVAFLSALYLLQTTHAVLGPWDGVLPIVFVLFFFSSFLLVTLLWVGIPSGLSLFLLVLQMIASLSVALIRFPLSFGFDPLIHHAAEQLVLEHGSITPKTFYYLAQYAVVPFFARIFDCTVATIHQPLTVLVLGLSIPVFLHSTLRSGLLVLSFLLIPFPYLVMTTPWGLAYGTTLLTVLSSARAATRNDLRLKIVAGFLTMSTLMLHPLAGIPLVIFFLLSVLRNPIIRGTIILGGCVSVPLSFLINGLVSRQSPVSIQIPSAFDLTSLFDGIFSFAPRFVPLLDTAYFFNYVGPFFFLLLVGIGIATSFRHNTFMRMCLLAAASTMITALLTRTIIRFDALAGFEQQDYTQRLFDIAILFLLPVAAIALERLYSHIKMNARGIAPLALALLMAGLLTSSLYLSYPRNDAYVPSHAYTLSQEDITAVHTIESDAAERDYAVLSNQVVASAAIREFGFKRYFNVPSYGEVFYYPIPSGSPLAQHYYTMLRAPSRETARAAMAIVGVDRIYFVVRDYEFRFPIIVRDAKATADEWHEIDGGKVYVFVYKK